jgi:hypothetical protein
MLKSKDYWKIEIYMVGQIGSMDKVVEYYNKSSEEKFRAI